MDFRSGCVEGHQKSFLAPMWDISLEKGVPTNGEQGSMLSRKTPFDWLKFGWMNTKTTTMKDSTMIWYVFFPQSVLIHGWA